MATTASIAQKFAGENLDLILGVATPTTQALVKAITTSPIVFTAVTDPVGRRPGQGPRALRAQRDRRQRHAAGRAHPRAGQGRSARRQGRRLVYNAGESNSVFLVRRRRRTPQPMGLTIVEATASTSAEVQAAAQSLVGRVDAITVIGDNTAVSALESIVKVCRAEQDAARRRRPRQRQARRRRRPTASTTTTSASRRAPWRPRSSAARRSPTSRWSSPQNLQLSINEKAAAAQGVTIPPT